MVIHQYNNISYLDDKIQAFWKLYKDEIFKLSQLSWKQEDITGKSYAQWHAFQYHNALRLVILLYLDIEKNGKIYTTWEYYKTKYKLDKYKECLVCAGIDLDKILNIFNLPFEDCTGGIECMDVEGTFIVEGGDNCGIACIRILENGTPRITEDEIVRVSEQCI